MKVDEIKYTVKFKLAGSPFWKTISCVVSDELFPNGISWSFMKSDFTNVIVPVEGTMFWFSEERHTLVLELERLRAELEAKNNKNNK